MGRAYQNRKVSMAKTSDAKAKVYSKYGREIYVSAKSGGVDPAGNLALRGLIERARMTKFLPMLLKKQSKKQKEAVVKISRLRAMKALAPAAAW